ncbi:MAG: winged helix-turn-helix transcriptional regulator [Candidatus Aminicenantes bacterium]|nr:winged helix-turn-helix transcriptional regulator [Candidatus Aminicenantes bacterium]MCK4760406.1 winged helix-turn-helix transcriptional regulator [Candidatus Aminicenantes bacterium]
MNTQMHKDTARKFKALAHPMRLKLMQELIKGECCVGEVQKCLSVSQPNASQHLKILKEAELIESRRERKKICYRVSDDPMIRLIKNVLKENFNE